MIQSNPVLISMDRLRYANSIHHSGSLRYVFPNHAHIGDTVTIRLRAALNAPIKQVLLRTAPDGEQNFSPMHPEGSGPGRVYAVGGVLPFALPCPSAPTGS